VIQDKRTKHNSYHVDHHHRDSMTNGQRWFKRTQDSLENFYSNMGDMTQDLTTMPNGDVYSHGHPIAPGSHMPNRNHTNNIASDTDRKRSKEQAQRRREEDGDTRLPYQRRHLLQGITRGKMLEIFRSSVPSTNVGYANGLGHRMGAGVGPP
jgi:hypothetical protein